MLTLKEVYNLAKQNVESVDDLEKQDVRLEQAEFDKEHEEWNVVVSYLVKNINTGESGLFTTIVKPLPYERVYKKLVINDDGTFEKLLIYKD